MKKIILILAVIARCDQILASNVRYDVIADNDNGTDLMEFVLLDEENPCARKCEKNVSMTCTYQFELEWYNTMSRACYDCPSKTDDCFKKDCIPVDGIKRPVVVINRKMPGPSIEVCLGDEIIVNVTNYLSSDSTTIHWHGIHQQDNPYMDGVPFISQCPILPGSTFVYQFKAINVGTHFWHSHIGLQRSDGTFGPFIVRAAEEDDPHSSLYDHDLSSHVITVLDWTHDIGVSEFVNHYHSAGSSKPDTILINGLGRFDDTISTPVARFVVEKGSRYRFRVINAGFLNCPIEIFVDNHRLTVISSDGSDFVAVEVDSFVTYAGERFDFILEANQTEDVYWMHFRGLMDCISKKAYQVAVLEYKDAEKTEPSYVPDYDNSARTGIQLNPVNQGTEADNTTYISFPQLKSLEAPDDSLKEEPDFQYYVSYDFYNVDNTHFNRPPYYGNENLTSLQQLTPQLNHISMKLLPFPLLAQRDQIDESLFCNKSSVTDCEEQFCECPHVVSIALNDVVEIVLIDKGYAADSNHPFHLHGYSFKVVAMERLGKSTTDEEVQKWDSDGKVKRNLENPPSKDTVTVPDGGYTIIRFKASNPGYWLFHCHIEFHAEVGMALVFKVGENSDMVPVPSDFPRCGDYIAGTAADDCDEVNALTRIIRKWLPKVYSDDCPDTGSNKASSKTMELLVLVPIVLLLKLL